MLDDNQVLANQASVNGGGIECNGVGARLVLDSGVWINANQATFLGGGIHARSGCEVSSFASPPRGLVGNIAGDGGGVSVVSGSLLWLRGDTIPFFGLGDPAQPPIVQSNLARNNGGGIFVSGPGSRALLTDAWVGLNRADFDGDGNGDGGGIFLAGEAELEMDRTLDEADCHRPLQCSRLYGNQAVEGGAIHLVGANARADIRQTWIDGNRASGFGSVVYAAILGSQLPDGRIPLNLEGNVLTGNLLPGNGELLELRIGVDAGIVHNTFADNADSQFDATVSIGTNSEIDFFGNLIREGFGTTFSGAWNAPSNPVLGRSDCTVGIGIDDLPPGSTGITIADPLLDADLRPSGLSPAVDACSGAVVAPTDPDLANVTRGFDVVGVSNGPGTLDAGAFEFVGAVDLPGGDVAIFPLLVEVDEGVGDVVFLVERTGTSTGAIEVQAQTVNGTATGGSDFTPTGVGLSWADGELGERWFTVPILDDAVPESTEQFRVVLSVLSGSPTITSGTATVRLFDNEQGIFADGFEGPGSL